MLDGEERKQLWVLGEWGKADSTGRGTDSRPVEVCVRACEEVLKTGVGLAARSSTSGTSRWGRNHFLPLEP